MCVWINGWMNVKYAETEMWMDESIKRKMDRCLACLRGEDCWSFLHAKDVGVLRKLNAAECERSEARLAVLDCDWDCMSEPVALILTRGASDESKLYPPKRSGVRLIKTIPLKFSLLSQSPAAQSPAAQSPQRSRVSSPPNYFALNFFAAISRFARLNLRLYLLLQPISAVCTPSYPQSPGRQREWL